MDELLEQFVIEGRELVQQAGDDLLALERSPGDRARLDRLFRCVHTLKGSAAIFALEPMVRLLHAAEDRLDAARRGDGRLAAGEVDVFLDVVGRCDGWIGAAAAAGGALPPQAGAESAGLLAALAGLPQPAPAAEAAALPDWAVAFRDAEAEALAAAEAAGVALLRYRPAADCFFLGDDPLALLRALPGLVALRLDCGPAGDDFDPFRCTLLATAASTAPPDELRGLLRFQADQVEVVALDASAFDPSSPDPSASAAAELAQPSQPAQGRGSLRVAAARLDGLIEALDELLAAKNGLAALLRRCTAADASLAAPLAQASALLDRQVAEAHHRALRLRLVPLAQLFGRLPRLVRETAAALGKRVDLAVGGGEIEVDRSVADGLFEPLLHLLRNAVDHGIEAPERRLEAGKPAAGTVRLDAERVPRGIVVTIADDGGGLDAAKIRATAAARGLIDAAATPDAAALTELLFQPGFSTAEAVTGVSGRGVGLDAVRAAVEALGGTVTLRGEAGRGSTFRLLLPQRAAIAPVIVVRAGGERWGVPAEAVAEVLRPARGAIVEVQRGRALAHRGRTLAVVDLAALVGAPSADPERPLLLVARAGDEEVAVAVAAVEGREDVLLRPSTGLLAAAPALQGTAVLGDGSVLMVLDLDALVGARHATGSCEP